MLKKSMLTFLQHNILLKLFFFSVLIKSMFDLPWSIYFQCPKMHYTNILVCFCLYLPDFNRHLGVDLGKARWYVDGFPHTLCSRECHQVQYRFELLPSTLLISFQSGLSKADLRVTQPFLSCFLCLVTRKQKISSPSPSSWPLLTSFLGETRQDKVVWSLEQELMPWMSGSEYTSERNCVVFALFVMSP